MQNRSYHADAGPIPAGAAQFSTDVPPTLVTLGSARRCRFCQRPMIQGERARQYLDARCEPAEVACEEKHTELNMRRRQYAVHGLA